MLVVVRANPGVCEFSFVLHGWCSLNEQVSEARSEGTFSADDAACLTLIGAVIQLRCSEIVLLGCGLLSCIVCGVFLNGLWVSESSIPSVSSHSPSSILSLLPGHCAVFEV